MSRLTTNSRRGGLDHLQRVSGIKAEIEQSKINDLPRNNLRNFFAKEDGISLYDRVKDKDGNIEYGAIDRMLQTDLTPLQRSVLECMNDHQSHWTLDNLAET